MYSSLYVFSFFFFTAAPTSEIYTLSLHDALPISHVFVQLFFFAGSVEILGIDALLGLGADHFTRGLDRKSTRLNSSHGYISYAVFCLKKKKITTIQLHLALVKLMLF